MTLDRSNLAKVLIATTLLAGCIPAESFDSEYIDQFENGSTAHEQLFASSYFPPSFADPQVDCGFPGGPKELIGKVEEDWYPSQWKAAREPSFYLLSKQVKPPDFALRFSYIPSFTQSVFIRIQKEGDEYWLIAKEMDGAGGYDPGSIDRSKKDRLSSRQVAELQRLMTEEALFSEPSDTCQFGFDGTKWIYELIDPNGYRMVKRWSPNQGAGYNLGRYLIELSGWNVSCWSSLPRPFSEVELVCE
jgi:hypothetical protein